MPKHANLDRILIADDSQPTSSEVSSYSVLTPVTAADDNKSRPTDRWSRSKQVGEIRAAVPTPTSPRFARPRPRR
jgi:hypothetical protein